jgi:hypothetical protein
MIDELFFPKKKQPEDSLGGSLPPAEPPPPPDKNDPEEEQAPKRKWRWIIIVIIMITTITGGYFWFSRLPKKKPYPETLPVYVVTGELPGANLITRLHAQLRFPLSGFRRPGGPLFYEDTSLNLRIITKPMDQRSARLLRAARLGFRKPQERSDYRIIDLEAMRRISPPDSTAALRLATRLFLQAGIPRHSVIHSVRHTIFSASYLDTSGRQIRFDSKLDTRIIYEFRDSAGYPFKGPGANMSVAVASGNRISQLTYAWRRLQRGPSVRIIPEDSAMTRIARLLPAGAEIHKEIIYWCPPVDSAPNAIHPKVIIPWITYYGILSRKDRQGRTYQTQTRTGMIPATDDPGYVPKVRLTLRNPASNPVSALATVEGGAAPYHYAWSGSGDTVSRAAGNKVVYNVYNAPQPTISAPNPNAAATKITRPIFVNENLGITVTDANGISVSARTTVAVAPIPRSFFLSTVIPDQPSYGVESPAEPSDWMLERTEWEKAMRDSNGGVQQLSRYGNQSWPGDYIRPAKPGNAADSWIYGNADVPGQGINTVDLVFINGDASPDAIQAMYPNAPANAYTQIQLNRPTGPQATVHVSAPDKKGDYPVPYAGSWGPGNTNGHLYWIAGLLCHSLDSLDTGGFTTAQRWGPAFGGLHIFAGFASDADYSNGAFGRLFAQYMLGSHPQPIRIAWFNACHDARVGRAAAMGPIGPGGVTDADDYYLGRGGQGPTLTGDQIKGWWYMRQ